MRIVPEMPYLENGAILDPTNVRICGADGGIVLNGEWVEYTPDEEGVYNIKITMHSSQVEGQIPSEQGTISFYFIAPNFEIEPGYYYDDEQEYLDSLESGVPDEPIQEEAYIEASVVAAIAAAADKAIKNVHASEPWQMMIYAFDNSDLEYIADYGLYDPEEPTPGVIAGGFVNADSYSEVEGQEGYSGDECVYFMAYETAEQANAAGISHFGKGAWASVLPAPGAYADKVVRVVGNCVLAASSDEVLDAFLAGGEKQTDGFIAVCMQIMQSVKEDRACAEMHVERGSGGCTVYVQSTVDPQYSSEFKTLQAEYFADEQERAEALAYFEELAADRSHFGEGSSAWEEAGFACMYGVCPEPGLYFQVSEDGTYAIASYYIYDSPDPVTVTVPAEWNGLPVTYMSGTFIGAKPVKEVILPDTLKTIGYESFADSGLARITIPASVTEIDLDAFRGCTNLEEIHIEEGSPLGTDSIWRDAFVDTAWYAAQPDGPLYIDGILVGYKN